MLLGATLIRVVAFSDLVDTPFARLDRWRQTDMHYYSEWAQLIATGDWRSADLPLPMHRWHREVAERARADRAAGMPAETDEVLWRRWMRSPEFYQDPLYAYMLAALYSLGWGPVAMLICQMVVGVLTVALVRAVSRIYFGQTVGDVSAVLASLCSPMVFYELVLLRDGLVASAGLAILWLFARTKRGGPLVAVLLGAALAAALLVKGTLILLGVVVFIGIAIEVRARRIPTAQMAAVLLGAAIVLAPVIARNVSLRLRPLSLASSGPLTFFTANESHARADVGFGVNVEAVARWLTHTDGGWRAAVAASLREHTPASYAALAWRKFDRAWHWFEIPNNENFYYFRRQIAVLRWLPITFGVIAPLALVGLALAWSRWRQAWPLYGLCASALAPLVAFYVLGRFRLALLMAVLPFAAFTLVWLYECFRQSRYRAGLMVSLAVALIFCWTGRPLASDQRLIRTADWILAWSAMYEREVYGALDANDPARAAAAYMEFFNRYEPTDAEIVEAGDRGLALELADMHAECAQILSAAGQTAAAALQAERAKALASR